MLCKTCSTTKKGYEIIYCSICLKEEIVPKGSTDICQDCSDQYGVCQICGKQIYKNEKLTNEY